MPQLRIENLTKHYAVDGATITAVNDVSFDVEEGAFVSIVGHSGSGKTTLLSIVGGMTTPTRGRVLFNNRDLSALDSDGLSEYRCEKAGFMFQSASLLPILTAKENLLLPVAFRPKRSAGTQQAAEQRAVELLQAVGLGDKINAYPSQLSGGQQRRVAIARAFMNGPDVVLADEPTGDLDEETEAEMMRFFMAMNRDKGTTFILVTHNTELARQAGLHLRMHRGAIGAW